MDGINYCLDCALIKPNLYDNFFQEVKLWWEIKEISNVTNQLLNYADSGSTVLLLYVLACTLKLL